jgi:hypothetical protein
VTPKQFHDIAMSFPGVEAGTSYGMPSYKAFGKFFTRLRSEDDSIVLGDVRHDEREMLLEADPETFHLTDHYRSGPWVLARLKKLDVKRARHYLERHWRSRAPKSWLKAYDAGENPPPPASPKPKVARARARR